MEAPLAYWLTLVEHLVQARVTAVLDEHGVTRIQWRILSVLDGGPATMAELQQSADGVPPADDDETVETAVAELLESSWLSGSAESYELAAHGDDAVARLSATIAELRASALEGISADDEAVVIAALQRIAENLDESN